MSASVLNGQNSTSCPEQTVNGSSALSAISGPALVTHVYRSSDCNNVVNYLVSEKLCCGNCNHVEIYYITSVISLKT